MRLIIHDSYFVTTYVDPKVAAHQLLNVSSGEEDIDDENELLNDLPPKTAILRVADNGNPTGEQHCADEARECERNSEHVDEAAVPDPTFLMPSLRCTRVKSPDLPDTVTKLTTEQGAMVYLVGTAHFSESSQQDVAKVGCITMMVQANTYKSNITTK